jgi:tetratricopeptide (TPR) repeat protein
MNNQKPIHDTEGLEAYFTDVKELRDAFKSLVEVKFLSKRLLVIHGVGGVGKSSILRMFRLHCERLNVPIALASGDTTKSELDVLSTWAQGLAHGGVKLPGFTGALNDFRAVQAKVVRYGNESAGGKIAKSVGKAAINVFASSIPVLGPILSMLGDLGADALVDRLSSFLPKQEVYLLLNYSSILSDKFLIDIHNYAKKQRLVLLLDTYEQMTVLDDWVCSLLQRADPNVLFVIAGRGMPNWDRNWGGWIAEAHIEELKPMSTEVMRDLIQRYYQTIRGGEPDSIQVEAIVNFARGLPIVVTSAVRLWVQYGVEDFQAIKPQVVADLVDRLMEGVSKNLIPALEASAIVRWFTKPTLRAVSDLIDIDAIYDEIRRFPFVRSYGEGLAIHDIVRDIIDENLSIHDRERHKILHERAAAYYEKQMASEKGDLAEKLIYEYIYHKVKADEETGIRLFRNIAGGLEPYHIINQLRTLLNDVNTYQLKQENSRRWREYYNARLAVLEGRSTNVESAYKAIGDDENAEPLLRAYALCDLGEVLAKSERLSELGAPEKAMRAFERSRQLAPDIDSKLAQIYWFRRGINTFLGKPERDVELLKEELKSFKDTNNKYGMIYVYASLRHVYGNLGFWQQAEQTTFEGLKVLEQIPNSDFLRVRLMAHSPWYLVWTGQYARAEQEIKQGLRFIRRVSDVTSIPFFLTSLGLVRGLQKCYVESSELLTDAIARFDNIGGPNTFGRAMVLGFSGTILRRQGRLDDSETYLENSLSLKQSAKMMGGVPELHNWLGELYEVRAKVEESPTRAKLLANAEEHYQRSLDLRWTGRRHYECIALTGLARVRHAMGNFVSASDLVVEAEQIAHRHCYYDCLASLRLTQAQIVWDGQNKNWGKGFDDAIKFLKDSLTLGLRYNRFLLDEILSDDNINTPLHSIVQLCGKRSMDGKDMLIALRQWWESGQMDSGSPFPSSGVTQSNMQQTLIDFEYAARQTEPGDSSSQQTLLNKIDLALQ